MGTVIPIGLAPRRDAVLATLRTGSDLDTFLHRAIEAHMQLYGSAMTLLEVERTIIKAQMRQECVAK